MHNSNPNQTRSKILNLHWSLGKVLQLLAYNLVIKKSTDSSDKHTNQHLTKFYTDSDKIIIDNRFNAFILHKIDDLIGPLKDVNISIKGFGG